MSTLQLILIIVLFPLIGAVVSGLLGRQIGRTGAHCATIAGVGISLLASILLSYLVFSGQVDHTNVNLYSWADGGSFFPYTFHIGFLIDSLTAVMILVVNFVSFLVHIYSIGYMADDAGYQRFFSYISLFTFMMLMLVTANNFLQLFFGWEGVGLVSYLLIGFWYSRESAIQGSLKAFLVNRVGDFGFILGIGLILTYTGTLDYAGVFQAAPDLSTQSISLFTSHNWSIVSVICILLFVGAMGKSAQVPLHVWLPESMEGPTPISALIHAATMVTAGVFMLARISPLLEYSTTALSFIVVIGATGALFTGILAVVMNDIKRVIAYSTLSQLGYMMVAMGLSAYPAGLFHLLTHACFKALLFLAAGSVILGMHHEQDMRKMGGLWRKMPITYVCYLIGCLALCAVPPFAGFYSKDLIIEIASLAQIPGAQYAFYCVSIGAMVTALYTFRSFFMTFHGKPRMDDKTWSHVHESPAVVWFPLVMLAIPSIIIGYILLKPMIINSSTLFSNVLYALPEHRAFSELVHELSTPTQMALHAPYSSTFWLMVSGIALAWVAYLILPGIPSVLTKRLSWIYRLLVNKYGFDSLNEIFFVRGTKAIGQLFYQVGDRKLIDAVMVEGSAKSMRWFGSIGRSIQSGYLYHYATLMIVGLTALLCWMLLK